MDPLPRSPHHPSLPVRHQQWMSTKRVENPLRPKSPKGTPNPPAFKKRPRRDLGSSSLTTFWGVGCLIKNIYRVRSSRRIFLIQQTMDERSLSHTRYEAIRRFVKIMRVKRKAPLAVFYLGNDVWSLKDQGAALADPFCLGRR